MLDTYRSAAVMPMPQRQQVRDHLGQVIDAEWPLMQSQSRLRDTAAGTLLSVRDRSDRSALQGDLDAESQGDLVADHGAAVG